MTDLMLMDRGHVVLRRAPRYLEVMVRPERLDAAPCKPLQERQGLGRTILLFDGKH